MMTLEEQAYYDPRPRWVQNLSRGWKWNIRQIVGIDHFGMTSAPLTDVSIHKWVFGVDEKSWDKKSYYVISFFEGNNEIGMGRHDQWQFSLPRREWHKAVMNYLKMWVFIDWFGLRTKIYFWTLK